MGGTDDRIHPVGAAMAMAALLVLPATAPADSGTWTNTFSGNWSVTNNSHFSNQ